MTGGIEREAFQIQVAGEIDQAWKRWLGLDSIVYLTNAEGERVSLLAGCVADESGLRGVMSKLWDLNLKVLSVVRLPREEGGRRENPISGEP